MAAVLDQFCDLDCLMWNLNDFDDAAGDFHAHICLRYVAQRFQQQSIERLCPSSSLAQVEALLMMLALPVLCFE
jgi:hypothetical protein